MEPGSNIKEEPDVKLIAATLLVIAMLYSNDTAVSAAQQDAVSAGGRYKVSVIADQAYLPEGRSEKLDIYYPADAPPSAKFPGILMIHGGGWMNGDKAAKREKSIANDLVPNGYVCVSINYKLGDNSWPRNLIDCQEAIRFMQTKCGKYGLDPDSIAIMGGSAGGHLALMLALTADEPNFAGSNMASPKSIKAVIDLYGVTNVLTRQETDPTGKPSGVLKDGTTARVFGCKRGEKPSIWKDGSPVNHVKASSPPILILHGMADTTVDYQQSTELYEVCKKAGSRCQLYLIGGLGHTFDLTTGGYDLRPIVLSFLETNLRANSDSR